MAISRTSYAIGNAEQLAARGRCFVRNEIRSGGRKVVTQAQLDELGKFLNPIRRDWRIPIAIRDQLARSIWDDI